MKVIAKEVLARILERISIVPNAVVYNDLMWTYDFTTNGTAIIKEFSYTTKTGRFLVFGTVPLKTSRYTSAAYVRVNNQYVGGDGTNFTGQARTVIPMAVYSGQKGATYTLELVIQSQDSGTTAIVPNYNPCQFGAIDIQT